MNWSFCYSLSEILIDSEVDNGNKPVQRNTASTVYGCRLTNNLAITVSDFLSQKHLNISARDAFRKLKP